MTSFDWRQLLSGFRFARLRRRASHKLDVRTRNVRAEQLEERAMFAAGELDPTFNAVGFVQIPLSALEDQAYTMKVQPWDNKIVIAGERITAAGVSVWSVMRRNADGTPDVTFNSGAALSIPIGSGLAKPSGIDFDDDAAGERKIVVSGSWQVQDRNLTANGTNPNIVTSASYKFSSFDINSTMTISGTSAGFIPGRYTINAVDPQGNATLDRNAAAQNTTGSISFSLNKYATAVARITAGGVLDTDFNQTGLEVITASYDSSYGYAIQAVPIAGADNDKILLGGSYFNQQANRFEPFVMRLNYNGSYDTTFGGGDPEVPGNPRFGMAKFTFQGATNSGAQNSWLDAMYLYQNNVYVSGSTGGVGREKFVIARLNNAGVVDSTVGAADTTPGYQIVPFTAAAYANALTVQTFALPDGSMTTKLLAVGTVLTGSSDYAVARFNIDTLTLDTTFGTPVGAGAVRRGFTSFGVLAGTSDRGNSITIDANDDIIVAGSTAVGAVVNQNIVFDVSLARLHKLDGSLDLTFGKNGTGTVLTDIKQLSDFGATVGMQFDNFVNPDPTKQKIIVAGSSNTGTTAAANYDWLLLRYTDDASQLGVAGAASVNVSNATVTETNGQTNATFVISLSSALNQPVSVTYTTVSDTATVDDYTERQATVTIPAGRTSVNVSIPVTGDLLNEDDETFFLRVTNVNNASLGISEGKATIVDNDPLPTISAVGASVVEPSTGTVNLTFTFTMSAPSGRNVFFHYATADGTAASGGDFVASSGEVSFFPGESTHTITVQVKADTLAEASESFQLTLSNPTNITLSSAAAQGTILPSTTASVWQNAGKPLDVDGLGDIAPRDALIIINDINANGARALSVSRPNGAMLIDTNGDRNSSPIDALLVINYLNAHGATAAAQANVAALSSAIDQGITIAGSGGEDSGATIVGVSPAYSWGDTISATSDVPVDGPSKPAVAGSAGGWAVVDAAVADLMAAKFVYFGPPTDATLDDAVETLALQLLGSA